jgi:hypothetical protein
MTRRTAILSAITAVVIVLLWLLPPAGLVATLALLAVLPPWGRSITERAVISGVVLLGIVAVGFPRAGSTPVNGTTARILLTVLVLAALVVHLVPRWGPVTIPRPSVSDGIVWLLALVSGWWLMAAYVGQSIGATISGLFYSGWDNQGHFTTFANTYEVGSTTWPTVDGSVAWNQWYPTLHTTLWSLAQHAAQPAHLLDRPSLVGPFVQWSAISFALCLAALAWVAGDVAARIGGRERESWTRPLATGAFAIFGLLGSPALLFNAGFTNFMMGVTIVVVVAYVSARSLRSARVLGWFLIPLGALAVIGLWTPLVLGIVPSGVVVAIALWKRTWWLGTVWLLANAAVGAIMAVTQTAAILGVDPGQSSTDFTKTLGSVASGMVQFNLGLALLSPVIVALAAILLVRKGSWPLAVAIVGPVLGAAIVAIVFARGADAADIGRLQSYYVLKPLDAMLLAVAPLIAALVAVALTRALAGVTRTTAALSVATAAAIIVGSFGYLGALPGNFSYATAPGIQAGADRTHGINDPLEGVTILRAAQGAAAYPKSTTFLWDGAGTLPNLWVASLHSVMSRNVQRFYLNTPPFPYDNKTLGYLDLGLNLDPTMTVTALWFRPSSGELLNGSVAQRGDDRVVAVQIPMEQNVLCPECSP